MEEQDLRQTEESWTGLWGQQQSHSNPIIYSFPIFSLIVSYRTLPCGVCVCVGGCSPFPLLLSRLDPGSGSRTSRNAGHRPSSPHPRALGQKIFFLPYLCMLENLSECLSNIKPHCYTLHKQSMGKNIVSCGSGTVCHPSSHRPEWSAGEDFPSEMPQPDPLSSPSFLHPGLLPPVLIIP